MAKIQSQFDEFHERIKLKRFDDNHTLRQKRDILRKRLRAKLPDVFAEHGETCPAFDFQDQGSYEMGTGIKPSPPYGSLDIDQGMYFAIGQDDYRGPVVLKQRVHAALVGHTKDVQIRRSCVTVFYQEEGEEIYHVDLALYTDGSADWDGKTRLAKGKENSSDEHRFWEVSAPGLLAETIRGRFASDNDRDQFRRTVRYLKRWRDHTFHEGGNSAPSGIALTVAVSSYMQPRYTDPFTGKPDDLAALELTVDATLRAFRPVWDDDSQSWLERLTIPLPIEPWGDLLARMTNRQMGTFKQKLDGLLESLRFAGATDDRTAACEELKRRFGDDFPVPDPEESSRVHTPAIISSSTSA